MTPHRLFNARFSYQSRVVSFVQGQVKCRESRLKLVLRLVSSLESIKMRKYDTLVVGTYYTNTKRELSQQIIWPVRLSVYLFCCSVPLRSHNKLHVRFESVEAQTIGRHRMPSAASKSTCMVRLRRLSVGWLIHGRLSGLSFVWIFGCFFLLVYWNNEKCFYSMFLRRL